MILRNKGLDPDGQGKVPATPKRICRRDMHTANQILCGNTMPNLNFSTEFWKETNKSPISRGETPPSTGLATLPVRM
jgi:hypothetical protein